MEGIIETKASTIVPSIQGLRGDLYVTFQESTWAAWLYDLLKPYVTKVVVCDRIELTGRHWPSTSNWSEQRPSGVQNRPFLRGISVT